MALVNKTQQTTNAQVLRDEIAAEGNTRQRVYDLLKDLIDSSLNYLQVQQVTGASTSDVMSQKAVTDALAALTRTLSQVLTAGNDAGTSRIVNLGDPVSGQDADTLTARNTAIASAIDALKGAVPTAGDTLEKLYNLIQNIVSVDKTATDIADRDSQQASMEDQENIYVADASDDATVDAGWAIYKYIEGTDSFVKIAEQESIDVIINDATDAVKGIVMLQDQTGSEDAATNGTVGNVNHTKSITGRGMRWFWDKVRTLAQTISETWTFVGVKLSGQIESGKKVLVFIDTDGTITKIPWADIDTVTRKITKTGVDDLAGSVTEEWKNSSGSSILQLLNDLSARFGGASHFIKVNSGVPSGSAKLEFLDNLTLAYILGTAGQNFIEFKSTTGDQLVRIKVRHVTDYNNSVLYEVHLEASVTAAASGVTVIGTFPAASGKIYNIESSWIVSETGGASGGCLVDHTIKNLAGTTSAIGSQNAPTPRRSVGDWTGNILANDTNDTIDFSFTNSSSPNHKAYKVNIVAYIHETLLS